MSEKIRACICCGGGFSSSTMADHIAKGIVDYQLQDAIDIEFCPFQLVQTRLDQYDILILCPHLQYEVKQFNRKHKEPVIPMYLLPIKMYGPCDVQELYWDVVDILDLYKQNPVCPVQFPDENNCLKVKRTSAYRTVHPEFKPQAA